MKKMIVITGWKSRVKARHQLFVDALKDEGIHDFEVETLGFDYSAIEYGQYIISNILSAVDMAQREGFEVILVGHSLGGFWARHVARLARVPCILLNPSLIPWESEFADALPFDYREVNTEGYVEEYVFIERGDDVVDFGKIESLGLLDNSAVIWLDGGNHRFVHYREVVRTARDILNGFFEYPDV